MLRTEHHTHRHQDPRIHPMTSVASVEVTPDLKYRRAYISVLGNEDAQNHEGLKSAEGYVRRNWQEGLTCAIHQNLNSF